MYVSSTGGCRKKIIIIFFFINILYKDIIWFMSKFDLVFGTKDIDRAVEMMEDADSNFINHIDEYIAKNTKSIYWKDYALKKR